MSGNKNDLHKLDVRINACIYWNKDSNFGIYDVQFLNSKVDGGVAGIDNGTVTGNFDKRFHYGEEYIMYGEQKKHPKYGLQWLVSIVQHKMDTPDRIKTFLYQYAAPSIVDQIVAKYGGEDILQRIIDGNIDYSDIKGMKEIRFQSLREKVMENEYMKDIVIGLSKYGITPKQMKSLIERFGAAAISKIEENPYHLCKIKGVGFLKADEIAANMGFDMESPHRIHECVKYVLISEQKNGNSWVSEREVVNMAFDLMKISKNLIQNEITNGIESVITINHDGNLRVAMENIYEAEKYVADWILDRLGRSTEIDFDVESFINEIESKHCIKLTDEQKGFFWNVANHSVSLLIGYAGTGKSFLLRFALEMLDRMNMSVLLCAPTGKASKVLETYTNRSASTIHRAFSIFGKGNDEDDVSDAQTGRWEDSIFMDESSMVDVITLSKALKGIENHNARMIFIGDDFQLPSVGVGNFLYDAIQSSEIPTTRLTQVFRQVDGGILDCATKVRLGEPFVNNREDGRVLFGNDMILHCCDPSETDQGVISYYKKILAMKDEEGRQRYGPEDIVVLSPTRKGVKGVKALNDAIQNLVNPPASYKAEVKYGFDTVFRVGDRIINTQNNYQAINIFEEVVTVFNGDMGVIVNIDSDSRKVTIDYGFDKILTSFDSLDAITHAYCLTIHRSQGSGFPVVIMLVDNSHQFQLNANLIYTGITRAQKYLVMLGQAEIINRALKKNQSMQRNSFLKDMLKKDLAVAKS